MCKTHVCRTKIFLVKAKNKKNEVSVLNFCLTLQIKNQGYEKRVVNKIIVNSMLPVCQCCRRPDGNIFRRVCFFCFKNAESIFFPGKFAMDCQRQPYDGRREYHCRYMEVCSPPMGHCRHKQRKCQR